MKLSIRKILYGLLALLLIIDFYAIFNAGNPNSLIRHIIPDPSWDIAVTVGLSLLIAVISLIMFQDGHTSTLHAMLESNRDYILELREQGKSDREIADSFVQELGRERPRTGKLFAGMLRKRVAAHLKRIA